MMFKRAISVLFLSFARVGASDPSQTLEMGISESLSAAGGTTENVEFDPPMQVVDITSGDTRTTFTVTLESLMMGSFQATDMLFGSDSLTMSAFTYSPEFVAAMAFHVEPVLDLGIYPSDLLISGYSPTPISPPMNIGSLEVDAAGLPCGDYEIVVNSAVDAGISGAFLFDQVEPLFGLATVRVVDGSCPPCDTDSDCNDNNLCNGVETCDPSFSHCIQGTPPDCNDNIPCTIDSCNTELNACSNEPNHGACSDGLYCNGSEKCVPGVGCRPGPRPCAPTACNEATDTCRRTTPSLRGSTKHGD